VLGLVGGWALRPLALHAGWTEPMVSWTAIVAVFFVAALLGTAAYSTWRTVERDRQALLPHQAVNRLALGKACAVVGALIAGAFFGYAVAQLGVSGSDLSTTRLWHAFVAGLGALGIVVAALLLERACRVPDDDEPTPTL
jgi:hypothetical protein